jgi:iron complex outermembrane receptor protein
LLRHLLLAGAATCFAPAIALAQTADAPAPAPADTADAGTGAAATTPAASTNDTQTGDFHQPESQEIIVTGFSRNRNDILSGTSVMSGETLSRDVRPSIGETLAHAPGVSATSFGPSASRPVLRGFQGDRVRILTDGLGSLDVSDTSADHAVAINPLTADRIEVLRGPAALLFGSSAIGGVVNVIDSRIPRRVPDEAIHAEGILTYGSAAEERSANGEIDAPLGRNFVLHFDGNYIKTDDLHIGGHVLTPALRAEAEASADPAIRALADLKGTLPNTASETSEFAGGLAWVDGENNIGFSVSRYDSRYGVPIRYSLDPAIEAEAPMLDLKQTREDVRAEFDAGSGFIDTVRFRAGHAKYRHFELEEDGAIGTTFRNDGWEGRLEAVQSNRGGWGGGFGVQYFRRDFDVEGDEKFLPPNRGRQIGLFTLQTLDRGAFKAEAGARYEHSTQSALADADVGNPAIRRSFDAFTGSLGASYALIGNIRFGINGSYSERAPSAEELFANGPHGGTQAFEIGDPTFGKEKSWGLEASLRGSGRGYSFGLSLFQSWFTNYIYEQPTGAFEDDLPVFQFRQDDARYSGIEFEGSADLARIGGVKLKADALADYVRATIVGVSPVPRIPAFRLLGGIEAQSRLVDGRVEVEWTGDQDRVAPFETPTDGYTLVNASLTLHPFGDRNSTSLVISANNIFDVDARRAASFLKDYAPLAGRDIRVSLHFNI